MASETTMASHDVSATCRCCRGHTAARWKTSAPAPFLQATNGTRCVSEKIPTAVAALHVLLPPHHRCFLLRPSILPCLVRPYSILLCLVRPSSILLCLVRPALPLFCVSHSSCLPLLRLPFVLLASAASPIRPACLCCVSHSSCLPLLRVPSSCLSLRSASPVRPASPNRPASPFVPRQPPSSRVALFCSCVSPSSCVANASFSPPPFILPFRFVYPCPSSCFTPRPLLSQFLRLPPVLPNLALRPPAPLPSAPTLCPPLSVCFVVLPSSLRLLGPLSSSLVSLVYLRALSHGRRRTY